MKLKFQIRDYPNLKEYCGWRIWRKPDFTKIYAMGSDVAEGVGADASCCSIIDVNTGYHVATYWSNMVDVDNYASELYKGGNWYNKAFNCIESNNHGHAVIALMGGAVGSLAYPNLYRRIEYDEYTAKKSKVIGFKTTASTKPRIIENLKAALRTGDLITQDRETILELSSFVRDQKNGRMGAKGKAKDDRVMALALAWEQAQILKENLKVTRQAEAPHTKYDPMTGFPIY